MKKILLLASIIATPFFTASTVHAEDSTALRICEYISVDDKTRLRSFLKQNKLKIRSVFSGVKCNGDNLLIFSARSKALDTGEFIIGKISKSIVKENLAAITELSAHLGEDAKARVE